MDSINRKGLVWLAVGALASTACGDDSGGDDAADDGGTADGGTADDPTGGDCMPSEVDIAPLDTSTCMPAATDYTPTINGSADDMWPACANDDGVYHPLDQPGAAARTEAFAMIRSILAADLSPAGFTMAREQYALDQGIESRTVRREDVRYPEIPEADHDPAVDADKQCTVEANVMKYPDRCAGPAKIAPIINDAFMAAQMGEGDPAVHAARIDAAIAWFMYLSVIKESTFSCPLADLGGDCDSGWGYYNGANARGAGIGFAADVIGVSPAADDRIIDGLSAMRCWRDSYPADMDADTSDPLYVAGRDQLDQANNHGAAIVLRDRMEQQLALCGSEADANWAWVQTFGQGLIKPAQDTDAGHASTLVALLGNDAPMPADIEGGIAALDALFPCP